MPFYNPDATGSPWGTFPDVADDLLQEYDWSNPENAAKFAQLLDEKNPSGNGYVGFLNRLTPGDYLRGDENKFQIVEIGTNKRKLPFGTETIRTDNGRFAVPAGYEYVGSFNAGRSNDIWNDKLAYIKYPKDPYAILVKSSNEESDPSINYKPIDFDALRDKGRYIKPLQNRNVPALNEYSFPKGGKYSGVYTMTKGDLRRSRQSTQPKTQNAGRYMTSLIKNQTYPKGVTSSQFDDVLKTLNENRSVLM